MGDQKLSAVAGESSSDDWDNDSEASNGRLDDDDEGSGGEGLVPGLSERSEGASHGDRGDVKDAKKEKRRRRRKKKDKDDGDKNPAAPSPSDDLMLPVEEADARYTAAIEALRANDDMCMWVQLPRCRLNDKKARKLCDAMRDNRTVTSIDVSDNFISDEGAESLTRLLASGAAPDLISLNVRGNPLSEKGKVALASVRHTRKLVKIDVEEEPPTEDEALGWNEKMPKRDRNGWHAGAGAGPGANGWEGSPMTFTRESKSEKAVPPQQRVEAALKAIKEQASKLVDSRALAQSIAAVVKAVSHELSEESPKRVRGASLEQLPKGLSMVAKNLPAFASVLSMDPPPISSQRRRAEPAAGAHRIALVDLLHRLLLSSCQAVDEVLLKEGVVKEAAALLFRFPWSSCLHTAVARLLDVALCRPSSELCAGLLEGEDGILERLARGGSAGAALPMGQRSGDMGHIVKLSKALLAAGGAHHELQAILDASERWKEFEGGALRALLKGQAGTLGGPKPSTDPSPLAGAFFDSELDQDATLLEQLKSLYLGPPAGVRGRPASA